MLEEILARFEKQAPVSVMARLTLEQALPSGWIDEIFQRHRQRQYPRELLFSTVVELMSLVSLGLRPSLHAAARKMENLPVTVTALYDKIKRTEPAVLRALVQGSSERLAPVIGALGHSHSLPGWQLRIVDGNHLPGSEKRLAPLREHRGAALPGHAVVVYDPDRGLVTDIVACEDAHESERAAMPPLLASAQPGQAWIADRHFCTRAILRGWHEAGAAFIVREHAHHPRILSESPWSAFMRTPTGQVHEQAIVIDQDGTPWRRIELHLDTPTESGECMIRLWSNLPESVEAAQIAELYRKRWRIESMFQRLESVLESEICTLGHPRAALLGLVSAILAYNVLSILKRSIEQAHREEMPELDVSTYHLAVHVRSDYQGMLIALPAERWCTWSEASPEQLAQRLLQLGRQIPPRQVATSKRGPKKEKPKGYVNAATAREHVSTARVLKAAKAKTP
jgi:IS4 transposase